MTRPKVAWLSGLLACLLLVSGTTAALIVHGEGSSALRIAQAGYDTARAAALDIAGRAAQADAEVNALVDRAVRVVDDAAGYQSLTVLDPAALAALPPLIDSVEALLAIAPPTASRLPEFLTSDRVDAYWTAAAELRDWADRVERAWSDHPVDSLSDAVDALEAATITAAESVSSLGPAVLAGHPLASAESRGELQAAIDSVSAAIAAKTSVHDSLGRYAEAVRVVQESNAAAWAVAQDAAEDAEREPYVPSPPLTLPPFDVCTFNPTWFTCPGGTPLPPG